jgi:nucleoside-diphosphate-sugar epimerase
MRVTLIGAQGFVGSAFARLLKPRKGVELVEVTRQNYARLAGTPSDIVIEAACNSLKFLADQEPLKEFEASVVHRLKTLVEFPAEFHLHLSSVDVYSDLTSPGTTREDSAIDLTRTSRYGLHKLLAEQLVRHYAKRWLIVRLAGMVGPGLKKNPVFDILNGHPLRISPDSQYQFMNTDDMARVVWGLLEAGRAGEVFNVCGEGLITPSQIAELAGRKLNLTVLPAHAQPRVVNVSVDKIKRLVAATRTVDAIQGFIRACSGTPEGRAA